MNSANLPDVFCWTKMGTDAGQSLEDIIARKEAERELGSGVFFWGIGTSLGQRIWKFIDSCMQPTVLFSPMKAKPKQIDIKPEKVFVWTAYIDRSGVKHSMPRHALVTSRGSLNGSNRKQHYALVCQKNSSLIDDVWPSVDWAKLRNYDGESQLGYSQVTAVVEYTNSIKSITRHYEVLFGADLVEPYYVKLVDPIESPGLT